MPRHPAQLNGREARKRLLIAESDLLRASLAQDVAALTASVRALHARTSSLAAVFATVADLAGALIGRTRSAAEPAAPAPWWRILLDGLAIAEPLWRRWRARGSPSRTR